MAGNHSRNGQRETDDGRLATGRRVGPYRILGVLGRGGTGTVYLAERTDRSEPRQVALKVLRRGLETDELLRRFRLEREFLATLSHPDIVQWLDGGATEDGRPYLVMERVGGRPITEYCDARRLPVRERVRLVMRAAAAVGHAHRNLIVHQDLKPSNIVVSDDGSLKLLDFGIAKLLEPARPRAAATPVAAGPVTPEYASPEQLCGEPATPATDIYQLGLLLFELLIGLAAHEARAGTGDGPAGPRVPAPSRVVRDLGARAGTIAGLRGTDVKSLRRRFRGGFDRVVLTALAPDPRDRYATVDALIADLERVLSGRRPAGVRPGRLPAASRRRSYVLGGAATFGLLAAVVVLGLGGQSAPTAAMLRIDADATTLPACESTRLQAAVLAADGGPSDGAAAERAIRWSAASDAVVRVLAEEGSPAAAGSVRVWAAAAGRATITAESPDLRPAELEIRVVPAAAETDTGYPVTLLGTLPGGGMSNAWTVNAAGVVAGWVETADGDGRSFRWSGSGCVEDLLGLTSGTRGMNEAGGITGHTDGLCASGFCGPRPYVYQDGRRIDLPGTEGAAAWAQAINNAGTVAGGTANRVLVWRPVIGTRYGDPVDLSPAGTRRRGQFLIGLNDHGDIVFTMDELPNQPYLRRPNPSDGYDEPIALGTPELGNYWVHNINNAGVIVGAFSPFAGDRRVQAVLWLPDDYDRPILLGDGEAWAINDRGQIAGATGGSFGPFGEDVTRPALWTVDAAGEVSGPVDLGAPDGYTSGGARAISENGWIAGSVWNAGRRDARAARWRVAP